MNKSEQIKAEKDGLDIIKEIPGFAQQGWEAIAEADLERQKWAGVFFRKHTPGFFMMHVRITNGITDMTQLRTLAAIAAEFGRGRLDITTRQQIQLRWLCIQEIPTVLARLAEVGLTSLQTGMDNIRNIVGCPVAALTLTELFDASSVARQFTAMVKEHGLNYVGLAVPVGRLSSEQLLEVCRLAERYGTGEVQLTPGQNLVIPHVPDQKIGDLTTEPLLQVLPYDPTEIMRGLVSCTGIEFCNLAVIETKQRALDIARQLEDKLGAVKPLTMAWSGCPAGCGNLHVADIGLQGSKTRVGGKVVDAVTIFIRGKSGKGARLAEKIMEDIPCDRLATVLAQVVQYYPRKSAS